MGEAEDRWNGRYDDLPPVDVDDPPPAALVGLAAFLPTDGFAVDLAGGDGTGGLYLARRGLDTTVVDVSEVALRRARTLADTAGVELTTMQADLTDRPERFLSDLSQQQGPGLITCFHYLQRDLLEAMPDVVRPGLTVAVSIATERNLERHARPSARFLLAPGELARLLSGPGVRALHRGEGWTPSGTHEAEAVITGR